MSATVARRCPYQEGREPNGWQEPATRFDTGDTDYYEDHDYDGGREWA